MSVPIARLQPVPFNHPIEIENVSATWRPAGHILGSATIEIVMEDHSKKLKAVFSGDDEMLIAVAHWICTLPLVLLLALPTFGVLGTSIISLTILTIFLAIYWVLCGR